MSKVVGRTPADNQRTRRAIQAFRVNPLGALGLIAGPGIDFVSTTIQVDATELDHDDLQNVGTNDHAAIDTHIADVTIHFVEGDIDHTAIQNIGSNSHAAIDSHIADTSIHFDEIGELSDVDMSSDPPFHKRVLRYFDSGGVGPAWFPGPVLDWGTYTPTVVGIANVDSVTAEQCMFTRIGDIVTITGSAILDATAGATATTFSVTLPIASANFVANSDANGVSGGDGAAGGPGRVRPAIGTQTLVVSCYPTATGAQRMSFVASYEIQ